MTDDPIPLRPPGTAQAVLMAREASRGAVSQVIMDLARIAAQIPDGPEGWPALADQLGALSAEIGQAGKWLRSAAGASGGGDDSAG